MKFIKMMVSDFDDLSDLYEIQFNIDKLVYMKKRRKIYEYCFNEHDYVFSTTPLDNLLKSEIINEVLDDNNKE